MTLFVVQLQASAQADTPSIDLGQSRWNKTVLSVLLITDEGQSWWQAYFPNMTVRAVQQWNDALSYFAEKYPQYSYLANVELITSLSNVSLPEFDIYIAFSPNVLISGVDALGETLVESSSNGTIKVANITLSAKSEVVDITKQDYRDTTVHELGHALGLGHSNSSEDLMYPYNDIFSSDYAISTLDLYGTAVLFEPTNTSEAKPPAFVVLPSEIAYTYAPVNYPAPTTIEDNPIVKFLAVLALNPITLLLMVVLVAVIMMLVAVIVRRRKHRRR
ncbi:matrixin family metalloprotease [Candidatus Bathyarchaeota archaeon]|nr:matrixin family metalloprotease [Candidatus Bathyarchaeota archaeon]